MSNILNYKETPGYFFYQNYSIILKLIKEESKNIKYQTNIVELGKYSQVFTPDFINEIAERILNKVGEKWQQLSDYQSKIYLEGKKLEIHTPFIRHLSEIFSKIGIDFSATNIPPSHTQTKMGIELFSYPIMKIGINKLLIERIQEKNSCYSL